MPALFRKMETRRLHNPDIKQLVHILRTDPHSLAEPGDARFEKATQTAIKKLPRRLRSSPISYHGSLCRTHKGLDAHLINDVWSWIKFELEVAIGRFLYPMVMSGILSKEYEHRVRQLEPVVRMFNTAWTFAESAAPGKPPIDAGTKWTYQENGCPACMLTRIGSDEGALFALFAGMYGHLRSRSGGRKGVHQIRSKRLRFVRYWMKTHPNGEQATQEAYDLGVELKAIRRKAKVSLRCFKRPTHYTRDSLDEAPTTPRHCLNDRPAAAFDISEPFHPNDWAANTKHDPKIGPTPPLDPTTHTVIEDWYPSELTNVTHADIRRASINIPSPSPRSAASIPPMPFTHTTKQRRDSVFSTTTTIRPRPSSSIYPTHRPSVAMLRGSRPASSVYSTQDPSGITLSPPQPASYAYSTPNDSRLTIATSIVSYNDPTKPSKPRGYDPMETDDEWMDRCTKPSKSRGYVPIETHDERMNEYMAKYRAAMAPRPSNPKPNGREAILLEGDVRHDVVQYEGQVLPKPSRCSMYSAFGEEGRDGEEFEVVDETPPPSPVGEGFAEEIIDGYGAGFEDEYGDPAPAPLRPQKHI